MRNYMASYSGFFVLDKSEFDLLEMKVPFEKIANKKDVQDWACHKGINQNRFCIKKLPEKNKTYPSDNASLLIFELSDGSLLAKRYLANGYLNIKAL